MALPSAKSRSATYEDILRLPENVAGTFGGEGEKRIPPFDAVPIDIGVLWDISPPTGC
jgi:hypothetical protein